MPPKKATAAAAIRPTKGKKRGRTETEETTNPNNDNAVAGAADTFDNNTGDANNNRGGGNTSGGGQQFLQQPTSVPQVTTEQPAADEPPPPKKRARRAPATKTTTAAAPQEATTDMTPTTDALAKAPRTKRGKKAQAETEAASAAVQTAGSRVQDAAAIMTAGVAQGFPATGTSMANSAAVTAASTTESAVQGGVPGAIAGTAADLAKVAAPMMGNIAAVQGKPAAGAASTIVGPTTLAAPTAKNAVSDPPAAATSTQTSGAAPAKATRTRRGKKVQAEAAAAVTQTAGTLVQGRVPTIAEAAAQGFSVNASTAAPSAPTAPPTQGIVQGIHAPATGVAKAPVTVNVPSADSVVRAHNKPAAGFSTAAPTYSGTPTVGGRAYGPPAAATAARDAVAAPTAPTSTTDPASASAVAATITTATGSIATSEPQQPAALQPAPQRVKRQYRKRQPKQQPAAAAPGDATASAAGSTTTATATGALATHKRGRKATTTSSTEAPAPNVVMPMEQAMHPPQPRQIWNPGQQGLPGPMGPPMQMSTDQTGQLGQLGHFAQPIQMIEPMQHAYITQPVEGIQPTQSGQLTLPTMPMQPMLPPTLQQPQQPQQPQSKKRGPRGPRAKANTEQQQGQPSTRRRRNAKDAVALAAEQERQQQFQLHQQQLQQQQQRQQQVLQQQYQQLYPEQCQQHLQPAPSTVPTMPTIADLEAQRLYAEHAAATRARSPTIAELEMQRLQGLHAAPATSVPNHMSPYGYGAEGFVDDSNATGSGGDAAFDMRPSSYTQQYHDTAMMQGQSPHAQSGNEKESIIDGGEAGRDFVIDPVLMNAVAPTHTDGSRAVSPAAHQPHSSHANMVETVVSDHSEIAKGNDGAVEFPSFGISDEEFEANFGGHGAMIAGDSVLDVAVRETGEGDGSIDGVLTNSLEGCAPNLSGYMERTAVAPPATGAAAGNDIHVSDGNGGTVSAALLQANLDAAVAEMDGNHAAAARHRAKADAIAAAEAAVAADTAAHGAIVEPPVDAGPRATDYMEHSAAAFRRSFPSELLPELLGVESYGDDYAALARHPSAANEAATLFSRYPLEQPNPASIHFNHLGQPYQPTHDRDCRPPDSPGPFFGRPGLDFASGATATGQEEDVRRRSEGRLLRKRMARLKRASSEGDIASCGSGRPHGIDSGQGASAAAPPRRDTRKDSFANTASDCRPYGCTDSIAAAMNGSHDETATAATEASKSGDGKKASVSKGVAVDTVIADAAAAPTNAGADLQLATVRKGLALLERQHQALWSYGEAIKAGAAQAQLDHDGHAALHGQQLQQGQEFLMAHQQMEEWVLRLKQQRILPGLTKVPGGIHEEEEL